MKRRVKLGLVVGGTLWLAGWVGFGAQAGFAGPWIGVGILAIALYAVAGWISYRGERGRLAGVSTAALLTLVVAMMSFFHVALLLGGLAVTVGCALRPAT